MRARLALAALVLAAAGCRTLPPAPGPVIVGPGADAPSAVQRELLGKLDRYSLNGRVAVAANGQGFTAALRYQQLPEGSNLALDGPLGIGGLRLAYSGDDLRVKNSKGVELNGAAARADLERRLGFELPLAQLRWWLLGVPAPGQALIPLEQDPVTGELRGFTQDGWRVSILSRVPAMGFALPQRLTAERTGARLKLVIERWQP
jgi:outer membrane lipoprotein LolB